MVSKEVKQMAIDDINFNLNGSATYSQAKEILKICKIVYTRATAQKGV